jgi:type IV pilus assembly protein PilY1
MKRNFGNRSSARHIMGFALAASFAMPLPSLAAAVALASQPMTTTATSSVKPNIMFILDNSGSMDSTFLPDWATGAANNLIMNSSYNGVYYNPAITYTPPVLFTTAGVLDTTTYPNMAAPWTAVRNDAFGVQSLDSITGASGGPTSTSNLVGNSSYYTIVPGEYCAALDLKSCVAATAPSVTYPYPAPLRWCSSNTNANAATPAVNSCQAINTTGFTNARYPKGNTTTITVGGAASSTSLSSITVGGQTISGPVAASTPSSTLATNIAIAINKCSATIVAPCTTSGFSATVSGSVVTITANGPGIVANPSFTRTGTMTVTSGGAFSGGNNVPGSNRYIPIIPDIASYPYPGTTGKAASRTDCTGTTCNYTDEMNNFANWWTYYHSRLQAMKSSVSRAFKAINSNYRVGFSTISYTGAVDGSRFLGNSTFETTHKYNWFTKLFAQSTTGSTPLRGALSKAGRYYADKISGQVDPVQYSCQQNFTILSTDGYWNTGDETTSYRALAINGTSLVGNQDASPAPRPMYEGPTAVSNSLADVAKYYYETDLRTTAIGNCSGAASPDFTSGNPDVCTNNVYTSPTDNNTKQHMTTFTMGLGADGLLNFQTDYDTATSGDFYKLKTGLSSPVVNWPDPKTSDTSFTTIPARIDDMWHAAVNGRGAYFSAKDPDQIVTGFTKALSSITAKLGAASAAATSTLNPVAGNNFAYVASYTTVIWKGNLEARTMNLDTAEVSNTATWCVENIVPGSCPSPGTVVVDTSGSNTVTNCVVTGTTAGACPSPGVFNAGTCTTEIAHSCTGTMPAMVGANSDSRTIYTNVGGTLTPFTAASMASNPNFSAAHIAGLNGLNAAQLTTAAGANLVNYLRGQNGYEIRAANALADRLFRAREATLGDALESQPSYISKPTRSYPYPGYDAFKTAQAGRAGTVYMGANDGMLHAFNSETGVERWAYIPSMVLPNLWKLASTDYSNNHVNFVNGSPVIGDVYSGGAWHTILVGGLNGGGRGYYALDITNPDTPALLWEFTPTSGGGTVTDPNLGYTFGRPVITKKADDTWVVLVTSGYDNGTYSAVPVTPIPTPPAPVTYVPNSPAGDGQGYLYVLNAYSGNKIGSPIATTGSGGSAGTPSGLAQIVAWNDAPAGNEAKDVYGGDLLGNVWRFDLTSPGSLKFATLSYSGTPQPITTAPSLGLVKNKHVIFVGTGKYLERSDLIDQHVQTLYAIKDDSASTTLINPRGSPDMVQQTITNDTASTRVGTHNPVDFNMNRGWYADFPDISTGSERENVNSLLMAGYLLVPTIVPSASACSPGGYGWMNYFDYENGSVTGVRFDSPIVGFNIVFIHGHPVPGIVTAVDPTPQLPPGGGPTWKLSSNIYRGQRSVWREFIPIPSPSCP